MSNEIDTAFDNKKIVINWDGGSQGGAGMAVCNGTHIQYAIPDSEDNLTILTSELTTYQATHQIADLNYWTVTNVASQFPKSMSNKFIVTKYLSCVSLGDYNYVFWTNLDGDYMALRCRPDMLTEIEVSTIDLSTNYTSIEFISNMAVFGLPSYSQSFKGKIGFVILGSLGGDPFILAPGLLDPNEFQSNSTWTAVDPLGGEFKWKTFPQKDSKNVDWYVYTDISAAWVDQGLIQVSKGEPPKPFVSLVVSFHTESSGHQPYWSYGCDFMQIFDLDYEVVFKNHNEVTPIQILGLSDGAKGGATISTTPDGSLQISYQDKDKYLRIAKLFLNTNKKGTSDFGKPGLYNPAWINYSEYPDKSKPNIPTHNTPCSVFVPLPPTIGDSPYPVTPSGGGDTKIYHNCPSQGFVQCLFTSGSGNIPQISTFYWGEIFGIPNYMIAPLSDEDYKNILILSLVADTFPFPIPAKSVWGPDSPSGMINWLLCTYEYLVGDETEVDLEWNLSSCGGYKGESVNLATGLGFQVDQSIQNGFSTMVRNSDITRQATSFSVTTKGVPPVDQNVETLTISNDGALFGSTPAAQIGMDLYLVRYRGRDKENADSPILPAMHPILDSSTTSKTGDFKTYCYIPGNPASYLEYAINDRMKDLYNDLLDKDLIKTDDFVINGENFNTFYSDGNYLNSIVERFGVNGFGTESNLPFIEFSFSETGIKRSEFQSTSSFTYGGGTFLNYSFYTGLSWDSETEASGGFLGIAELESSLLKVSGFLMMGVEFSSSLTTTNSSSNTWGINLGEYLNPLGPGEAYTVRMYFLKPSPLWARELQAFGQLNEPADIDLINSCPIRILFTVSYISDALLNRLNGLGLNYVYNPKNDPPPIFENPNE